MKPLTPSPRLAPLLALLSLSLLAACSKPQPVAEEIRPVKATRVGQGLSAHGQSFAGEIRARHETRLAFRVPGKITERLVNAGERVRKGQPLLRLDSADYALELSAKQAQLASARAQLVQQEADLKRARSLLAQSFISQAQFDRQAAQLDATRAQLRQAEAQAAVSGNQQDYTVLRADADGVISDISAEPGMVVAAGQAVAQLAADGEREVAIQLPENALQTVRKAGDTLSVRLWSSGQNFPGRLREIAGSADPVTRTYAARVGVAAAPAALQLGQSARVDLPAGEPAALALPLSAILDTGGRHYVWVVDGKAGTVKRREVRVSALDSRQATLAGGVTRGETVVTAGVHLLREGQKVSLLKP